ncbi:hypothetical protein HZS_6704 [Henneguya salminicola]|nr:hypothetical protein HZS_6704 [Henneguya salminicola]
MNKETVINIIFAFNTIFLLICFSSIIITGIYWNKIMKNICVFNYFSNFGLNLIMSGIYQIVVCFFVIICFFYDNYWFNVFVLILLVFNFGLNIGYMFYISNYYQTSIYLIKSCLVYSYENYQTSGLTTKFDFIHKTYMCCGIKSYLDWKTFVPFSCCKNSTIPNCSTFSSNVYSLGCQNILVRKSEFWISSCISMFVISLLFTPLYCVLLYQKRRAYESNLLAAIHTHVPPLNYL